MPIVSTAKFLESKLDYIIVGGGTAGLAVAARLTENSNIKVGVLEAGGYDPDVPQINTPGMRGMFMANPKYDWTFPSTPQKNAHNRQILQHRGKALGGSSMLNFMCWFRPTKEEYDILEQLGNEGWNWDELLRCHKKSETTLPIPLSSEDAIKYSIAPTINPQIHGTDGPIVKSIPPETTEIHALMLDSLEAVGIPRNPDVCGGSVIGGTTVFGAVDSRTATRSYAASGYFEPNKDRPNFLVLTEAYVTKILLEDCPGGLQKCVGVEFQKDDQTYQTKAPSREVILSAGSFKTPHILELSGIGNRKILAKHGIDCKIHLPGVGENLQDHVTAPTIVEVDAKYETIDKLAVPEFLGKHVELYKKQQGYLAHLIAPAFAFANSQQVADDAQIAKWRAMAAEHYKQDIAAQAEVDESGGTQRAAKKLFALNDIWLTDETQPLLEVMHFPAFFPATSAQAAPGKAYTTLFSTLAHPYSRGNVHLTSSDPLTQPAIDVNYLANPADLDILAYGIDFNLKLWETVNQDGKGLKNALVKIIEPSNLPPSGEERIQKIKDFVKTYVASVFHTVGTASMLPKEDGGVVAPDLKVYGTSNIRVADVSILPFVPSVHIQSTAYAIGEKAAEIIANSQ